MVGTKPLKTVSEATRERETFRYLNPLFFSFSLNRDGSFPSAHDLRTPDNCVLTGLAQLGVCQTGTERAFVSFFDSSHQYIVEEATSSMRIAPNIPSKSCLEPLLLCGTAVPRNQGTCDHVLYMNPSGGHTPWAELPLLLIPNLAEDTRFSSRPYCQFGGAGQFYAGVPIRTSRGINIGTYCVMSTTQPPQWDDECTQRLRDISLAIREHLELRRSKEEARSHARVNRGLGSFIAGKGTLTGWQSGANIDASLNDAEEGGLNAEQQHEHESLDLAAQHDETFTTLQQIPTRPADVSTPTPANSDGNGLRRIFSKAGNIIREAFEVEGCLLLRCRTWLLQTTCNFTLVEVSKSEEAPSQTVMTSSSDEQPQNSPRRIPDNASCDLLGFSTTDASSVNDPALLSKDIGCIPQRFLAKLLQRYPNGKIFNFDGIGELQTSDSSGYDDTLATPPGSLDPLQRVILSTDLLNDTNLSVFQKNAIHTIETCGRTLLDTIEPLLDYSKINSFAAKAVPVHMRKPGQQKRGKTDLFGKKSLFRHTRVDVLVEDVAESVFSGFIFQHMSVRQLSKQRKAGYLDTAVHNRLDAELAMEQLGLSLNDGKREHVESKNTSVYITIDPSCDWMFYTQPGALRRIFMYLLGNSLKYTTSGTIRISLSQRPSKRSSAERSVTLTVCDTGKGMGEDYMRHKLFKPFSQETDLTPGTGLGLSLVKRITSKLHGQISVESQIGVSTTVTVTLPLEQSLPKATEVGKYGDDDADFKNQVLELTNLRIRLRGFSADWIKDGRAIVEDICRHWLHLDPASDEGTTPDIVLWSEDALPSSLGDVAQLAKMPNVVVCRDALAAYQLMTRCEPVGQDRVFEYISQPLGPRSLARSLMLAHERWAGLPKLPALLRPPAPARSHSYFAPPPFKAAGDSAPAKAQSSKLSTNGLANTRTGDASQFQDEPGSADRLSDGDERPKATSREARKFLLVDDNHINLKILSPT